MIGHRARVGRARRVLVLVVGDARCGWLVLSCLGLCPYRARTSGPLLRHGLQIFDLKQGTLAMVLLPLQRLRRNLKALTLNAVGRYGYHIQKYPLTTFSPISVFDLSIQFLMVVRGERLNFIQVGANDGKSGGDPLHRYILNYPWHGILVEPQPDIFAKLRENYAAIANRLIFENIAIAKGLSTIAMYKTRSSHPGPEGACLVSTSPQVAARSFWLRPRDLERIFVPCATLDDIVRKHSMSNIDVLQIDAEGSDFDVLKTLDLSKTSPLIVQFEHGHLAPQEISAAVDYLNSHGYRVLYGGHQIDTLALHKSFPLLDAAW